MKRIFKISDAAEAELLCRHRSGFEARIKSPSTFTRTRPPTFRFSRGLCDQIPSQKASSFLGILGLFSDNPSYADVTAREKLSKDVSALADRLVRYENDFDKFIEVLEEEGVSLLNRHRHGYAFLELLKQLGSRPQLALEVFNWRRQSESEICMIPEEYVKGITVAGRTKNVDIALELFTEAVNKRLKRPSTYNALMGAYMYNGLADKCLSLFQDLKTDTSCRPSVAAYNILLSTFGRKLFIDQMEAIYREMIEQNLSPNLKTYNTLIDGYLVAWMWNSMEKTFQMMKAGSVKPDIRTYKLMLRGYAHSRNLKKMEETYNFVKHHVDEDSQLVKSMIWAYYRSSETDRVRKIENLMRLLPEERYRPWLNVLMIKLYAQENCLDDMEILINEAFEHRMTVLSLDVLRCIITSYFRCNVVDKLANFGNRAQCAGWRIGRCLYHCKMVMYSAQHRLEEMERVLKEMENVNMDRTKKTFWILYKAYLSWGERHKLDKVRALMCKNGYGIPVDASSS
ncbi:pentatricopeptide repeat-containing protein [Tripterygium wilfordii]|uniref:Pentatricopeptide repeat-containing protein n=1 Tax=Tripterygium wilfordii TaxID=458696 RepID=A0A7J7CC99_TRIWF|nr:pentatricopeptide repeat-containing protein At2g30780 [Tripterygium wilfordii]KAF5731497.1 pentatricopeptide repeat-containing protein [Tripterygium wilfordii]